MATRKVGRSAITGEFVSMKEVQKHPKTTIVQKVKIPKKGK
ncbi:hypothetical protein [Mesoterricola sediminis]|uniref:Uncharacterized protein n=1 Tax=Mesoterricola sediminis TaxID=2927980 RepID=A0AA48KCU0_9BACT|nr:hypothetical protein [Mesoterricola sediminis]BDU76400.1 hypothetical protein METESE_13580 [Mesoterricola sediminis]